MRSPARSLRSLIVVCLAALALPTPSAVGAAPPAAKPLPALTPAAPDALSRALADGRIDEATYALERVASLFDPADVRARYGDVGRPDPRAATLLFRDLAIRAPELRDAERERAQALLARPTEGGADPAGNGYAVSEEPKECSTEICVHYVGSSGDAPPLSDTSPADGVPDWVATTATVMDEVWAFEVDGYGFRAPKSDASSDEDGGNGKLDVYLVNIGGKGLYGYCTSDDPHLSQHYAYWDLSAYCVVDDDYAEFGYPDPVDPLAVTAAHEFHHAVQFAYDGYEDGWIMESSSTWIEDEVYDDVDDNLQYLTASPLAQPLVSLDKSVSPRWYGAWIFLRFLSEYVGANDDVGGAGPDPSIVRSIWSKLDGAQGGPDQYSTKGVASAIAARTLNGSPGQIRWVFADFGVWNAAPTAFYDEGARYPAADIAATKTLSDTAGSFFSVAMLDHLANRFVNLKRGSGLSSTAKLRVTVDGPDSVSSPEASAVVVKSGGGVLVEAIALDGTGRGSAKVPFGSTVSRVIVIATNASVRYTNCWTYATPWACGGGKPVDENRNFDVRATVI